MKKRVVYTVITNGYDTLKDPVHISDKWDYVVLSDEQQKSNVWKTVLIPKNSDVKGQRFNKIYNEFIFNNYEESLCIDGSLLINCNIDEVMRDWFSHDYVIMSHETNCIYQEAKNCISVNKDTAYRINKQMRRYRKEGYPKNNGLCATGIMYRKHTRSIIEFSKHWMNEVKIGSHRDQLSFNYSAYKKKLVYETVPFSELIYTELFKKIGHNIYKVYK